MYEYVDWMKCKHCGNTKSLFKVRVDWYYKKQTGKIRYKTTQICKICYLENCLISNDNWRSNPDNKIKGLEDRKIDYALNIEWYRRRARKYYHKHKIKRLEKRRENYIRVSIDKRRRYVYDPIN